MALSFYGAARYLTLTVTVAMVDEYTGSVNTTEKDPNNEEIMIPYNRILLIAWDKDAGARLKNIRSANDISQRRLAELTNGLVSYDTVVSLEQGKVNAVSREKLDALLSYLNCDVRSLFPTVTIKDFQKVSNS